MHVLFLYVAFLLSTCSKSPSSKTPSGGKSGHRIDSGGGREALNLGSVESSVSDMF